MYNNGKGIVDTIDRMIQINIQNDEIKNKSQ